MRERAAAEDGFTLIELLVGMVIALIVVGGAVSVFVSGIQSQPKTSEKSNEIQRARVFMEQVSRDVRESYAFGTRSASSLQVRTYVNQSPCGGAQSSTVRQCLVTYSCNSSGTCTRSIRNADGSGVAYTTTLVTGLSSNSVFEYSPVSGTPSYVGLKVVFPGERGDDAITLSDGVAPRNLPAS
ncbi:prepilin-type N-terminal cleavage/methylation domain-containing protein [Thermoleophilia bacterium SCSIO 60948]|nr:prepilin-type N-terminal cleavage/methylation domain-containing protein [Thermoleophilia bacterium SCSIO 60948]